MIALLRDLSEDDREALREREPFRWKSPMLATLTRDRFSDSGWIYERKLDGERCLAFRHGASVRLLSRNRKKLNDTYPEIEEALAGQARRDFVVDGEMVAFRGNRTSFERLQARMQTRDREEAQASGTAVYYYVFDLVYLEGYDLTRLALRSRKAILKHALAFDNRLRYTPHRNRRGEAYWEEACRKHWEGVIAKRASSGYATGRSRDWLKFKCVNRQEFVIGGWTDPEGSREGFGALLVGYHEDGALRYAGKVGTGYDEKILARLSRRLSRLDRDTPPFQGGGLPSGGVHWVTPKLVGEVGFTEWTRGGRLRHPRFLGLRRDKDPEDVAREDPGS